MINEIKENPHKIARDIAIYAAVEMATGAIPFWMTKIPQGIKFMQTIKKAKTAVSITKGLVRYGLPTVYAGSVGYRLYKTPLEQRPEEFGKIIAREGIPIGVGLKLGEPIARKFMIKTEFEKLIAKLSKTKQKTFRSMFKKIQKASKLKVKVSEINLKGMGRMPVKAEKPTMNFLKQFKKDVILGGSVSQRAQLRLSLKYWKNRLKDSDLDFYAKRGKDPIKIAKQYAEFLKKKGVIVRRNKGKIYVITKGKSSKLAEFHDWVMLRGNIEQVAGVFVPARSSLTKTPSGISILKVGTQGKRKLTAGFLDQARIATGKGVKDLADFKLIMKNLYKQSELTAKKSITFRKRKIKGIKKQKEITFKLLKLSKESIVKKINIPSSKLKKPKLTYKSSLKIPYKRISKIPIKPPYKTPPHRAPPYKAPPYKAPPYKVPPYKVPPYKAPPYKTPPHRAPPYKAPPYKAPSYKVPPYKAPPYKAPPYRAPPYKAPSYKVPPYKVPPYKVPPYKAPPYKAPPYKAPPYKAPPYKAPPYKAPPYKAPPYRAPPYKLPPYVLTPLPPPPPPPPTKLKWMSLRKKAKKRSKFKKTKQKVKYTYTISKAPKKLKVKYYSGLEQR